MIEIKNLTKRFDTTVALNNMNCKINEGTVFGLTGSNGSGKSTLVNLLLRLYQPVNGQVSFSFSYFMFLHIASIVK